VRPRFDAWVCKWIEAWVRPRFEAWACKRIDAWVRPRFARVFSMSAFLGLLSLIGCAWLGFAEQAE